MPLLGGCSCTQRDALDHLCPPSGKAALFIILKRYELNCGQALQVDLSALTALEFNGYAESYLDALGSRLSVVVGEPNENLLLAIVAPELRPCPELAFEFSTFDRALAGSHEQSLKYLYDVARALCDRKRRQKVLDGLKAPPKKVNQATKQPPRATTEKGAPPIQSESPAQGTAG